MFEKPWTWLVPVAAAAIVFGFVLSTTPPGWRAIPDVLLGSVRGPNADAAAYALGAAASLALVALIVATSAALLARLLSQRTRPRVNRR